MVNLFITHSDAPIEAQKNYDTGLSIAALKEKLYIVVGTAPQHQQLQLFDAQDKLVCALSDEKTLQDYNVIENMRIHVIDTDPLKQAATFHDTSNVKKYTISEEAYNEREDTFRKWKERNIAPKTPEKAEEAAAEEAAPTGINVGQRCELQNSLRARGEVMYVGKVAGKKGYWIGVKLDEPVGQNDGSVSTKARYFTCPPKYGVFVKANELQVGDFPERDLFADEDEI